MSKEAFITKTFRGSSKSIIAQANQIVEQYQGMGFSLTLRQLYYQFVARGLLPNKQSEYKRLGSIINDARLAGLLDWSAIEDRTRNLRRTAMWSTPEDILQAVANQYREDPWETQEYYPEVWIEKDALVGVIEPICDRMRVPFFACRGYASQSEVYEAGKRLMRKAEDGKSPVILHLGDHDPSGLDMTRDNGERLEMFARMGIEVRRLALNMDQVRAYNPPPNPAKDTDSRFAEYAEQHGEESWELDALDPPVIEKLIQDQLDGMIDADAWSAAMNAEEDNRLDLAMAANRWEDVQGFLDGNAV